MSATTLFVATFAQLNAAILQADHDTTAGDSYTITLTANIAETADLAALNLHTGVGVTIDGAGYTLNGDSLYRGLFVYRGIVAVQDLTIADAHAVGGVGGAGGGGGGAGLGGGLFVGASGTVTLNGVNFLNDAATGGAGGAGNGGNSDAGGGGGLGGAGGAGNPTIHAGGGGGIGTAAVGGSGEGAGAGGSLAGASGGGTSLSGGAGGASGGGGGGGNTRGGGGGGVSGENAGRYTAGKGGTGGGGGGAASAASGTAGAGGFGGGGGAGYSYGGAGGFGGGGGGGESAGGGGFGGGNGGPSGGGGGGGLGAGGDIFVEAGGSLIIEGGSLSAGTVNPGIAGAEPMAGVVYLAHSGKALGSSMFLLATATLEPAAGQTLTIAGTVVDELGSGGSVGAGGLIINGPGTVDLSAPNTFTGGTTLEAGTLMLGSSQAAGSGNIVFKNDPTLDFSIASAPTNTITGFVPGDTINITDLLTAATFATLNTTDDELSIPYSNDGGGTLQLQLDPNGNYTDEVFDLAVATAPLTGTVLTVQATCFCRGTLILTDAGEVPVEALRIGDLVITRSGNNRPIRWIGRRAYSDIFAAGKPGILPVRIAAGALAEEVPRRDLLVSPQHAMLIDDLLVPAGLLVNGHTIVQVENVHGLEYYHVELDSHDVILAEGAPSESFVDDDSRAMFDNIAEYYARYPDAVAEPAQYCAPRVEDGEALETIRRRLALRTAAATVAKDPGARGAAADHPSVARGYLDEASRTHVRGWAWNPDQPDKPIEVEVLDNGAVIARMLANRYRGDLHGARIGDGRHAFDVTIPGGLSPLIRHAIIVRTAEDGLLLGNAPVILEPATRFDDGLANAVANAVGALDAPSEHDRVLNFLAAQMERVLQRRADAEAQRDARESHRLFRRRWGPGTDEAADPATLIGDPGLRALVIDEELPVADRDAGSQAILSHMRALRAIGYAVSFVAAQAFTECDRADENGGAIAALEREEIACCRLPIYASVEEVLRRQAQCFDVIYLHRLSNAAKYLALARQHCPRARVIFSVADLHHLRLARQAAIEERHDLLAESRRVRIVECMAALSADAVLTHSEYEASLLRRCVPGAAVHVVPWAIEVRRVTVDERARDDERRNGVAFIANYGHEPNLDAARFLAEAIMPLVWRRDPTIACVLAGSRMPAAIRRLARPGPSTALLTLGHVPDLVSVFDSVRLTVAPLRYGAGVKGKVLASFAAGLPCVMTPTAAEGIDLPDVLSACVGASAEELAHLILRLHHDAAMRREAGLAGLAIIESHFGESRVTATLKAAIGGRHRPPPTAALRKQAAVG